MDVQVWAADRSYASVQLAEGQGCVTRVRPSARRTSSIVRCFGPGVCRSAECAAGRGTGVCDPGSSVRLPHLIECENDDAGFVAEVRSLSCISLVCLVVEFYDICAALHVVGFSGGAYVRAMAPHALPSC